MECMSLEYMYAQYNLIKKNLEMLDLQYLHQHIH